MIVFISQILAWTIFGLIFVGAFLLLFLIFFFTCGFRKKREVKKEERVIVDDAFIESLLNNLGGVKNIENIAIDNGRLKFLVYSLELVLPDKLKQLATNGVFITGNNVKMLFKYDAKDILAAIKAREAQND